ncbi:desampylase [Halorussus litoreus]|uniref:desampylase n=1 Tax=Halorussus litoreus TaxID=1710536 RepID=UPI001E3D4737|nr:desampylase [Halorussus litoreus]
MPEIVIPESIHDAMVAHARQGTPEEICGILAGTRGNESDSAEDSEDESASDSDHESTDHRVTARYPAENVADSPRTRYEIDPREQLDLMEEVESEDREVVGFYHSHPHGPAQPSATDAAQAAWPGRSYVIVSLADGENGISLGAWRWTGEEFVAESVRVVDPES